jgi:hypothetical protein
LPAGKAHHPFQLDLVPRQSWNQGESVKFISSLELSRLLFDEGIQPALAQHIPNLRCAAASLGMCSEMIISGGGH